MSGPPSAGAALPGNLHISAGADVDCTLLVAVSAYVLRLVDDCVLPILIGDNTAVTGAPFGGVGVWLVLTHAVTGPAGCCTLSDIGPDHVIARIALVELPMTIDVRAG